MTTKYANQTQLSPNFITTNAAFVAIADSTEAAIGKLQTQNFAAGNGTHIGGWNATTNTPTLANSTIEAAGNWYNVTAPGTVDFGGGNITFAVNDSVYSNGTTYQKGIKSASSIALTDAYILVGNSSNIATGVAMSGQATISNSGVVSLSFRSRLTASTFDGTIKGGGVQYFNTNITMGIGNMVLGTPYKMYNTDTVSHTITITGTSAAVIGGDALTSSLVQTVNPGTAYIFTLQDSVTVFIE